MPNFKSGNFKQKNKPFKGAKKVSSTFKGLGAVKENQTVTTKSKRIQKESKKVQKSTQKANRKNEKKALQYAKQASLTNDADRATLIQNSNLIRHLPERH